MTPLTKPVRRVTREAFFNYGPDRNRRFVATLEPKDLLTLRPLGRRNGAVSIALVDVYHYALLCKMNIARLEKARARKKQLADARERRRLHREIRKGLSP